MIPGITIAMGGNDWVVPPLTLGQLRRLMPVVDKITVGADMGDEAIAAVSEIVAAALSRNYPDMTPQRVEDLLDLGNARWVVSAVLTGSGLKPAGAMPAGTTTDG